MQMNLLNWFRNLWDKRTPEQKAHDDNVQRLIEMAYATGKIMMGSYDDAGNFVIQDAEQQIGGTKDGVSKH